MALTGNQKHYIKKNSETLELEKIASDLNLPKKVILKYLKKHLPNKKYIKIAKKTASKKEMLLPSEDAHFNLKQFCLDNLKFFVLFFILIFIIYLNAFDNAFVSDDITGAADLKLHTFSNLRNHLYWGEIIYFFLAKAGLTAPFFFRIINILLHLGSTCIIFILFSLLFQKKSIALIVTILFAVHPILIESITWISGRPYSQYGFFFLISFLLYLLSFRTHKNSGRFMFFSGICFFLSLISSEKAVALFAIFPLYELALGNIKKNWKKFLPFLIPTIGFTILYLGRTEQVINTLDTQFYGQNTEKFYNPLVQIPIAISSYLGLIFWPQGLSLYHTEMFFSTGAYIFCLLVFLLFVGLIFYTWKKNRFIFFWLAFFFISLTPTLTPLKVSWIVAERYVYIGSLGIFAVFAYFFNWLLEKFPNKKTWLYAIFSLIILALSVRTIVRNIDWDNEDNLWIATAKTSPSGHVIHNNLGDVYVRQKNNEKAVEEFKKATEINPRYADAYHNLANTYQNIGKMDEAILNYQKALEFNPKLWQSYQNLAAIYFKQNDFQKAHSMIKEAIKINPTSSNLQDNLKMIEKSLE